jgi:hypothetical protein
LQVDSLGVLTKALDAKLEGNHLMEFAVGEVSERASRSSPAVGRRGEGLRGGNRDE